LKILILKKNQKIVDIEEKKFKTPNTNNTKKILRFLFQYIIAAALLIYIFKQIPLSAVIQAIAHVNFNLLCVGLLISLLVQPVIADRLRRLADTQKITIANLEIIGINLAALFYGLFLPGGNITGIAIRLYKLSGTGKRFAGAGVIILLDRIIATITLCFIGIIFFLIDQTAESSSILKLMILIMSLLLFIIGSLYISIQWLKLKKINKMLNLIIFDKLNTIKTALKRIQNLSICILLAVCTLSFFAHLLGILTYYLILRAMGIDLSFVTITWIRSGIILVAMIPVSISGLGLREGTACFLMNSYGVIAKEAVAFSLLIFSTTVLIPGLLGGIWEISRLVKIKPNE
jgi:uncharacterized protein (TIRG00374 family)